MTDPQTEEHPSPFITRRPSGNSCILELNTCPICFADLRDECVPAHLGRDDHTWDRLQDAHRRTRRLTIPDDFDVDAFHASGLSLEAYLDHQAEQPNRPKATP